MLMYVKQIVIVLLVLSLTGYILSVLREKFYLKNNTIVIQNKTITQDDLNKADIKQFILNGEKVGVGDEIEVITTTKNKIKGTLIGFIKKEKSIFIITYKNELKKFNIGKIKKLKIISKYGKFFI